MAFDPVTALFDIGGKLIDKLLPDPVKAAEAKLKLAEMQQNGELAAMTKDTEMYKSEQEGVSTRWTADMSSDSWMAKNIRPLSLLVCFTAEVGFAIASGLGFTIGDAYATLMGQLLLLMVGAYFGGRSLEKIMDKWANRK